MLSLRLIDGLGSSAPSVVNIGNKGSLNGGAVASAVLAGVAEANRRFDAHYSVAVLRYCEDDTPPESIYQLLAFSIVERLVADPSFGASHLEKTHMDHDQPLPAKRVPIPSPECDAMTAAIKRAMRMTAELNKLSFDDVAKVRQLFGELTGRKVDDTVILIPPFYSAYGLDLRVGRRVFINQCCTIYDLGGVDIADDVMLGPNVNIITTGHPLAPSQRRASIEARPIVIEKNVWIATAATIIGGVTVGENSVVAAGAVVTKDVPPNSLAAGVPARVIRSLEENP
jgi:acetyltransferase-like isoleucine patch superfamily enzyme